MQFWKTIINGFVTASTLNADGEGNITKAEYDSIVEMYCGASDGYGVVETESGFEYAAYPADPDPEIDDSAALEILLGGAT